jgi:hypothetical protein
MPAANPHAEDLRPRLLDAWLRLEGAPATTRPGVQPEAPQVAWASAWARIQAHRSASGGLALDSSGLLRVWSGLPASARDLLALRVLGGLELASITELSGRPAARVEREWLLLGRRLQARDPRWTARLRAEFLAHAHAHAPDTDSDADADADADSDPDPDSAPRPARMGRSGRGVLLVLGALCFIGAALAPQLRYALLDPAQQRLQAPPTAPEPVLESVPLSAVDFGLWADPVEFALLRQLDFLLWRLGETADPAAPDAAEDALAAAADSEILATEPPAELTALAPWARRWADLAEPQRRQLLAHARLWQALTAAGQQRVLDRAAEFQALPPLQRVELRARFARFRELSPELRSGLLANARGLAQAAPVEQQRLRAEFAALPLAVRRGLMAGKSAELAELAREAFAFVPAEERDATVALLRGLSAREHALLRAMSRRLDPAQRETLRGELLAAEPAERAGLILARADSVGLTPR